MQIVIQLQKFAEAVKRIKGAVGSVNDAKAPAAKPGNKGSASSALSGDSLFGRDMSSILSTDLTDIDPSIGGQSEIAEPVADSPHWASCKGRAVLSSVAVMHVVLRRVPCTC